MRLLFVPTLFAVLAAALTWPAVNDYAAVHGVYPTRIEDTAFESGEPAAALWCVRYVAPAVGRTPALVYRATFTPSESWIYDFERGTWTYLSD